MYALRRFSTFLKDERLTKTEYNSRPKRLKDERRGRELARKSEAKRKQGRVSA